MMNGLIYEVKISSPLLCLFVEKENLVNKNPPIHIDVKNHESFKKKVQQKEITSARNKIQTSDRIVADKQSSVQSNQKSIVGAIEILSNFSQNSAVVYYRVLILVFLLVVALCFVGNVCIYSYSSLEWDNSQEKSNPVR